MIRILYGPDTYSRTIALNRIRSELNADTADEVRFDASVGMEQLLAALHTLPFLATRRVVIVDGLLARAQPPRRGASRTRARGSTRRDASGLFWAPLADAAPTLPPSTELILVDDAIDSDNPLLTALTPYAEVRQFRPLAQRDVPGWITARARDIGVRLAPDAVRLLADLCGNNLWAAESELEKLHLYVGDDVATTDHVRALAAGVREESIFSLVDAVVERRTRDALRSVGELRAEGRSAQELLTMVARQYRLLILARELASGGVGQAEIGRRIGVTNEFALRKVIQQSSRADIDALEAALGRILEADVAIKRGEQGEDLVLDLLVADLAHV